MSGSHGDLKCHDDDDALANMGERRYFAVLAAMTATLEECRVLRDVIDLAEQSWKCARRRVGELEVLRDALESQHPVFSQKIFFAATRYDCDLRHETLLRTGYG